MGCDGVWDRYVSNSQGLIDIVSQEIKGGKDSKTIVEDVLNGLLPKSPSKSGIGCDNMSIILIRINH
jgi:protein phosphatase PTC2/3